MQPLVLIALVAAASLAMTSASASAEPYAELVQVAQAGQREAVASQEKIDQLADQTRNLIGEYRGVTRQVDSLRIYNEQLEQLVTAQEEEIASIASEIEGVTTVEREIMPLMNRMVETLGSFVDADVPFLLEERRTRVTKLRGLLLRSDVTVAEKYRRLMEAFQIENDFGHTIESYRTKLELAGEAQEVDMLRVGRVALFYLTLDGAASGTWDGTQFASLDDRHNKEIRQGIRVARKQAPASLLRLPIEAATQAGESVE